MNTLILITGINRPWWLITPQSQSGAPGTDTRGEESSNTSTILASGSPNRSLPRQKTSVRSRSSSWGWSGCPARPGSFIDLVQLELAYLGVHGSRQGDDFIG